LLLSFITPCKTMILCFYCDHLIWHKMWGSVKSGRHYSDKHLVRSLQKVCKMWESNIRTLLSILDTPLAVLISFQYIHIEQLKYYKMSIKI